MTIDKLRTLITSKYQCSALGGGYQLKEPQNLKFPATKLKACKELLLCQFDGYTPKLTPFFEQHIRLAHTMVDYVAFFETKGICYVILIELSHKKKKTRQRGGAERLAQFIEQTAVALYNISRPFEYRYLIINTSPAKGRTKPGNPYDSTGKTEHKAGLDLNLLHLCM